MLNDASKICIAASQWIFMERQTAASDLALSPSNLSYARHLVTLV